MDAGGRQEADAGRRGNAGEFLHDFPVGLDGLPDQDVQPFDRPSSALAAAAWTFS